MTHDDLVKESAAGFCKLAWEIADRLAPGVHDWPAVHHAIVQGLQIATITYLVQTAGNQDALCQNLDYLMSMSRYIAMRGWSDLVAEQMAKPKRRKCAA